MKKLSSATETKLMTAIEKTAELVNDGMDPSEAIAKTAQDHGIPPGNINLMVSAYNTGRTRRQQESGKTPTEKTADFPLADAEKVLGLLYPKQVKTAAAKRQETVISPEYQISAAGLMARRNQQEKAASVKDWGSINGVKVTKPEAYPGDPRERLKKASANVERMGKEIDESRRQVAAKFDEAGATFGQLTDYFRTPGCTPIPIVKMAGVRLHGPIAAVAIDEITKVTPGLAKMAMHTVPLPKFAPPAVGPAYELLGQLVEQLTDYNRLKLAHETLAADRQQQAEVLLLPFVQPEVSQSVLGPSSTTKVAFSNLLSGLGAYTIVKDTMGNIAGGLQGPDEKGLLDKNVQALSDPAHEAKLRNIRSQAMLQDLMLNDQVIKGYHPDEVTSAYNDVTELAPHAGDQRLVMQSLLRKRLQQGALDPFELDQIMGLQGKLKAKESPVPATGGGVSGSVI